MENFFLGSIIGSAIGDAVGEIRQHYPEFCFDDIVKKYDVLRYTDDTAQSIAVIEFLLEGEYTTQAMGDLFLEKLNEEPDRGYGGSATIYSVAEMNNLSYLEARDRCEKAFSHNKGNWSDGAAMRVHPVGLCQYNDSNLYGMVKLISEIDHSHPIAIDGAYICAKLITIIISRSFDQKSICNTLIEQCKTQEFRINMKYIKRALEDGLSYEEVDEILGNISRSVTDTHRVIPYAIFSFLSHPDSFEDCLNMASSTKGDGDTISAIACSFSGAYLGYDIIRKNMFYNKLENKGLLKRLAVDLAENTKRVNHQ